MNAILLAAGFGTRLIPLTNNLPKCMVKIGDKPIIDIWIEKLVNIGIKKILINTHYLNKIVENHLKELSLYKKGRIIISYEKNLLGTAGTLIKNIDFFNNEDGMLVHADNFTTDNLENLFISHFKKDCKFDISMMVFKTKYPDKCGIVEINKNKIVTKFSEKILNQSGNIANCAIYIISENIFNFLKKKQYKDFSNEVIPQFINRIKTYQTNSFFIDIGDQISLAKANKFVNK